MDIQRKVEHTIAGALCIRNDMTRLECNRIILSKLSDYLELYPDMRFNQALLNLGINVKASKIVTEENEGNKPERSNDLSNEYYLESGDLLKRLK